MTSRRSSIPGLAICPDHASFRIGPRAAGAPRVLRARSGRLWISDSNPPNKLLDFLETMYQISIPERLTPETLFPFSRQLQEIPHHDGYLLDFERVGHVEPFGMLFLAALVRQFVRLRRRAQGGELSVKAANYRSKTYASWMGMFKSLGLEHGNEPGEARGSKRYIPLTRIIVRKLLSEARNEYIHHGEVVERESQRIAQVLTNNEADAVEETLTYAIREMMRNVVEHGMASHIWFAAQHWPTKRKVEIAILDEGIGLLASLKRNPALKVDSHEKALFFSLQPGISGVAKEHRRKSDGDWKNSGYGLYMASSLCQFGGSFHICSGGKALSLQEENCQYVDAAFSGVAVRLVLDTSRIRGLSSSLEELRRKGYEIAKTLGNDDAEVTASKMSRMLAKRI